jgi:hypothetical protein
MWYDTLIVIVIIGALLLAIICKLTKQTMKELFIDIGDFISERKENAEERYLQ